MIDRLDDPDRERWRPCSDRDVTEIVGALMQLAGGAELSAREVEGLTFVASGALKTALNEAFITLLEFAHDAGIRGSDPSVDRKRRLDLQRSLDTVGTLGGSPVRIRTVSSRRARATHPEFW